MLPALYRKWWVLMLRGLLAAAAGVVAVVQPGLTLLVLVILVGVSALVDGAACMFLGMRGGNHGGVWWEMVLLGLLGAAFGIATLVWPGVTALALVILFASWAIARGVIEVLVAVRLRKLIDNEWLLALSGTVSIAFGVLILARPEAGEVVIALLVGAFLFIFGSVTVAFALRLRALGKHLEGRT